MAMGVLKMERRAEDNVYLHKDFHKALNQALIYLEKNFGEQAVRDYLRTFARDFYSPLRLAIQEQGLDPLQKHFESIYAIEGGDVSIEPSDDGQQLDIKVRRCPALAHIQASGDVVSPLFHLTHEVVNEAICDGTPYQARLIDYDASTGACIQRFERRDQR
jgi:hypothetical protein